MQKQEKKFSTGHRSNFWIKCSFGIGHPPPIYQMQCICVGEGSRVPNLQTEFNYLDSFKSYGIFSDFVVPVVPVVPTSSPSSPRGPHIIPTSSPRHPHVIPIAPRRSPCGPHCPCGPRCPRGPRCLHPCCPRRPHVIPTSSRRFPDHSNPPDSHPTHPSSP